MLELTEALLHNARISILQLTHADAQEITQEKLLADFFAFQAGYNNAAIKSPDLVDFLPEQIRESYLEGGYVAYSDLFEEEDIRYSLQELDEEWADFKAAYPDTEKERFIFCPNGHNVLFTTSGYEECAGCGAHMTEKAEEDFNNALTLAGQLM